MNVTLRRHLTTLAALADPRWARWDRLSLRMDEFSEALTALERASQKAAEPAEAFGDAYRSTGAGNGR